MPHLVSYLEESARRSPDNVAVVEPLGRGVTYRELADHVARVAGFLVSRGVSRGDRVGIALPKSAAAVAAMLGTMKAGAAYVPIDWRAPPERGRAILSDCAVKALFADPRCLESLYAGSARCPAEIVVMVPPQGSHAPPSSGPGDVPAGIARPAFGFAEVLAHEPLGGEARGEHGDALAYILYTSGSTGLPKGVMLTHANATSFVEWCSETFSPTEDDRFSSHAPFQFDLSVLDLYLPLKHGARLCLISEDAATNPKQLAHLIAERGITVWYSVPAALGMMAEYGGLDQADASSLRLVLFAGEVFPVKRLRQLRELWPHPTYYNLYGPTETNVCTFFRLPTPPDDERAEPYPIGRPCSHCAALVLDEADRREVDAGREGLLYIAGPSVFRGYFGRPELGERCFIERGGRRWYNTGDVVVRAPDGELVYCGRRDRMVKRRGYRIELGEIESGLHRHELLREVAAVARNTPEGVQIAAFLVPRGEARPTLIELKAFCARELPSYMSPDAFKLIDELPRTPTGKIDYQALLGALHAT
ncbi:amino acid adenylation domain-containing protein [Sorangium sp. So ce296]|uniref:amino acid adenylation domain-containing protein n=1 Tax=Sorangium sp. So ce296 TaxID=3133296 RepID=UPI003F60DCF0